MPRRIIHPYSLNPHPELTRGDIAKAIKSFDQTITKSNADLKDLLLSDYIYIEPREEYAPDPAYYPRGPFPIAHPVVEYKKTGNILYQYSSRPLIEAIYIDSPKEFDNILAKLSLPENKSLQEGFLQAWDEILTHQKKETDLPAQLFVWGEKALHKTYAQINAMGIYSTKIPGDAKRHLLGTLALESLDKLRHFNRHERNNKFKIAQFKRAFVEYLHSYDRCSLFLMSKPKDNNYKTSDSNNLYLYKEEDGKVFYRVAYEPGGNHYLTDEKNQAFTFPADAQFNSSEERLFKYSNKSAIKAVLQITSERGHTVELNAHRDAAWKHIVANVIAVLLTGPIAHLVNGGINYLTTGTATFSFFDRTDSQKRVDKVQRALDSSIKRNLRNS